MIWGNWRCVFVDTLPEVTSLYYIIHTGGNDDGAMDPPLTFRGFLIDDCGPSERVPQIPLSAAQGSIGLGPIWFVRWAE